MTREDIDTLWNQALQESVKAGEQFTRYHFAALVAEAAYKKGHNEGGKDYQEIMMPAVIAFTRKRCAETCDNLPAPESCTGIESSLWDVAKRACGDAIRAGVQS
jgi:hypothetical protein